MMMKTTAAVVVLGAIALGACAAPADGEANDDGTTESQAEAIACTTCKPVTPPAPTTKPNPAPPPAPTPGPSGCGQLLFSQVLRQGVNINACGGGFFLANQSDANVVLYNATNGVPLWATFPSSSYDAGFEITGTGGLAEFSATGVTSWQASGVVDGQAYGSRVAVQDDGNVVLYRADGSAAWSTGTYGNRSTCGIIGGCNGKDASSATIWNECNASAQLTGRTSWGSAIVSIVRSTSCDSYIYANVTGAAAATVQVWLERSTNELGNPTDANRYAFANQANGPNVSGPLWSTAGSGGYKWRACFSENYGSESCTAFY